MARTILYFRFVAKHFIHCTRESFPLELIQLLKVIVQDRHQELEGYIVELAELVYYGSDVVGRVRAVAGKFFRKEVGGVTFEKELADL